MKKAIFTIAVIVLLLAINSLVHSIFDLYSKQDLLTQTQKQLEEEKLKNSDLKNKLRIAQSSEFIDQEAHNKLFLVKEGEQPVLIAQKLIQGPDTQKFSKPISNWQKWIDLFF